MTTQGFTTTTAYPVTLWDDQKPVRVEAGRRVIVSADEACEVRPGGVPIVRLAGAPSVCGPVLASALVASENGTHAAR
jgi:hypothetical protein